MDDEEWNWDWTGKVDDPYYEGPIGQLASSTGQIILDLGDCTCYYNTCGSAPTTKNAAIIEASFELAQACLAAKTYGSQGETENGISVSYLIEKALKKAGL